MIKMSLKGIITMQEQTGVPAPQPAEHQVPQTVSTTYQSNPFLVTARGIVTILQNNPVTAMLLMLVLALIAILAIIVIAILAAILNHGASFVFVVLLMALAYIAFLAVSVGSYLAVGSASTRGERITTKQAISRATDKALPLIGAGILSFIAIAVGFVLLVVPGFIMLGRLSLTLVVMMEENLDAIASLKRSWNLTKGHTIEMLGALFAGQFMSGGGLLGPTVEIAPLFGRYQDLVELERSGQAKPQTHWLNYLAFILMIPFVALMIVAGVVSNNATKNNRDYNDRVQKQLQELNQGPSDNFKGSSTLNGGNSDYNGDSGSGSDNSSGSNGTW